MKAKKILQCAFLAAALAMCCFGCAFDQYGRPRVVVTGPMEIAPCPEPYFWNGWYYYPFLDGTVWVYRRHRHPMPNWSGPPLRHHGPPPRFFGGPGPHHGGPSPGQFRPAPGPRSGGPPHIAGPRPQPAPRPAPAPRRAPPRGKHPHNP